MILTPRKTPKPPNLGSIVRGGCGARAANHQGTTRPAPRAARRRSSGAGGRWPTAPRQQFPRSTSRSPSRRPEGGSRETVSIPSRIPGLQSGPRPLPALAGLVPEPIMVGGVGGTPSAPRGPPSATSPARPSPGRRTTPCSACEEAKGRTPFSRRGDGRAAFLRIIFIYLFTYSNFWVISSRLRRSAPIYGVLRAFKPCSFRPKRPPTPRR